MKILFLTADLGGNIPPTLAVAEALSRRGVTVKVAGLKPGRTNLAQVSFAGATALKPDGRPQGLREAWAAMRLMASRKSSAETLGIVLEAQADLVVVDCMIPAVIRGALKGGSPVVVLFHTMSDFWIPAFDQGVIGRLFGVFGLRPSRLWRQAAARLLLTDTQLDSGARNLALRGYTWTGTTEVGSEPGPRDRALGRPQILVALSSTEFPGMHRVYRRIVEALSGLPVDAIVTTGGVELGSRVRGSTNVTVCGWVDHGQLLPTTDLMIGHGGHSSTLKALAHGVPLLVVPVNPIADQILIGRMIHNQSLGQWLPKRASATMIRDTVREMLADTALAERAAETGLRLRATSPGAAVAADRIMEIVDTHT